MRRLRDLIWICIGIGIVFCIYTLMYAPSHLNLTDAVFHANRAYQMIDCIDNDMPLWFYNNAMRNLGYGNSFFYGWLTLFPFLPVLKYIGLYEYIDLYRLVSYIVCFTGICMFVKRFIRSNYLVVSCIIVSQPLFYGYMFVASTHPSVFGAGLCLIFFAYCIDFFRDNKSFVPACIVYFLIFNTHMLSTIFGFVGCAFICISYFNKKKLLKYICFAVSCAVICFWNIAQVLYYFDCFSSNGSRISRGLIHKDLEIFNGYCFTLFSCLGLVGVVFGGACPVSSFACTISMVWGSIRNKKSIRELFYLCLICILFIVSYESIFMFLNEILDYKTVIQFPSRIFIYLLVLLSVIGFRRFSYNNLVVLLIYNLLCLGVILSIEGTYYADNDASLQVYDFHGKSFIAPAGDYSPDLFNEVGNGEYFPSKWQYDTDYPEDIGVVGDDGTVYDGKYNDRVCIYSADLTHNTSKTVEVNRMWYNGYVSNAGECSQSDNGFVQVDVNGYIGSLAVWYEYPFVLRLAFLVSWSFLGLVLIGVVYGKMFKI